MRLRGFGVIGVVVLVLAGCAHENESAEPAPSGGQTQDLSSLSRSELRQAAASMKREVLRAGSGRYEEVIVMSMSDQVVSRTSSGEWTLSPTAWEMTMTLAGNEEALGDDVNADLTLNFRMVDRTMYVNAPSWEGSLQGKWMHFTRDDVLAQTGMALPAAALAAPPSSILALLTFEATSGSEGNGGVELRGELPPEVTLQLSGIASGTVWQIPHVRRLVPEREVIITLDDAGMPLRLTIPPDPEAAEPEPSSASDIESVLPTMILRSETRVAFTSFGSDIQVMAPKANLLTDGM